MATEVKQTTTTLTFDLTDFVPLGEEKHYLLCLNENTYHVVWNLFQFYGSWLNRYTPDTTLNTWYQPEGEQAIFVGDMYDKGMEELLMPVCFDDLIEAINSGFSGLTEAIGALQLNCAPEINIPPPDLSGIEEALQDMATTINVNPTITVSGCGCSDDGGSGGSTDTGTNPVIPPDPFNPKPTFPPISEGEFPPTFGSYEQWQDYRCRVATTIVDYTIWLADKWYTTDVLTGVLSAFYAGAGVSGAVQFLAAAVGAAPGGAALGLSSTVVAAIALPLILVAGAIILTLNAVALGDISALFEAAKNGIVCGMLEQENAGDARQSYLDAIETILTENNVPLDNMIWYIYAGIFSETTFQKLFLDARSQLGTLPLAECDCGGDPVDCEAEYVWIPGGGGVGDFAGCTVETEQTEVLTVIASNSTANGDGKYSCGFTAGGCAFFASNVSSTGSGGNGIYTDCDGLDHGPATWAEVVGVPVLAISILLTDTPCTIQADVVPTACP